MNINKTIEILDTAIVALKMERDHLLREEKKERG